MKLVLATALITVLAATGQAAEAPKITHDWPGYAGPGGTYADPSKVPILDDLSQAKLAWVSEHKDMGYGKTSSGGGHCYGPSHSSGSCCTIVADGLVITGYFNPKNSVVADDVILALDAATGKARWKQVYAGKGYNRGARKHVQYGPTPAAADGKVFHLGSGGQIYCVELATGMPLWETSLGDYPERFRAAVAGVEVKQETKDGVSGNLRCSFAAPLTVIGGVLMVTADRLYAYNTATGKELWRLDGATRVPSPARIDGTTYAFCVCADGKTRLVEPKSGRALWAERVSTPRHLVQPSDLVADGRAFVACTVNEDEAASGKRVQPKVVLAAFALSRTGAKLLWQSKDEMHFDGFYAYRDGLVYANMPPHMIQVYKADDGALLSSYDSNNTGSVWGQFHLWGDRLVLIGDHCHESLSGVCTYRSLTPGYKDLKLSGQPLAPRAFGKYRGVCGYIECWMRPAFADGFLFTRAINKDNGHGAILCWDLRARPQSTWIKFRFQEPMAGFPKSENFADVEAEVEDGKVARMFLTLPLRTSATGIKRMYARGTPREPLGLVSGRCNGDVTMEIDWDSEQWRVELDVTGATPAGRYQRTIPALAKPTAVEGGADARLEASSVNAKRWTINLAKAACPDPNASAASRRDVCITVDRTAAGELEASARAKLNGSVHEVQLAKFESGEKTLNCRATILLHADKWVNPSVQRFGTVAMDVDITLASDGEHGKGTYTGKYGVAWTGGGTIGGGAARARTGPSYNGTIRCLPGGLGARKDWSGRRLGGAFFSLSAVGGPPGVVLGFSRAPALVVR